MFRDRRAASCCSQGHSASVSSLAGEPSHVQEPCESLATSLPSSTCPILVLYSTSGCMPSPAPLSHPAHLPEATCHSSPNTDHLHASSGQEGQRTSSGWHTSRGQAVPPRCREEPFALTPLAQKAFTKGGLRCHRWPPTLCPAGYAPRPHPHLSFCPSSPQSLQTAPPPLS